MAATQRRETRVTAETIVALASAVGAARRLPAQIVSVLPKPCFETMVGGINTQMYSFYTLWYYGDPPVIATVVFQTHPLYVNICNIEKPYK